MRHGFGHTRVEEIDQALGQIEEYLDAVAEEIEVGAAGGLRRGRTWSRLQTLQAKNQISALRNALAEEQSW